MTMVISTRADFSLKSEKVLAKIKESILSGKYKTGEKLPSEEELTNIYNVNRAAIRDAIRILAMKGFVHIRKGSKGGAYVADLSFEHMSEIFFDFFLTGNVSVAELVHVRQFIEPEVARLAALNLTEPDLKRLLEANAAEFRPISNFADRIQRLQTVHIILAQICGNRFLEVILLSTMKLTWRIAEAMSKEPEILHMPGEHHEIVEAIADKDAVSAKTMMTVHIYEFCHRLLRMEKNYSKRGNNGESRYAFGEVVR